MRRVGEPNRSSTKVHARDALKHAVPARELPEEALTLDAGAKERAAAASKRAREALKLAASARELAEAALKCMSGRH